MSTRATTLGVHLRSGFPLPGLAPLVPGASPAVQLELTSAEAIEAAWSGPCSPPVRVDAVVEGRDYAVERGSGGDHRFGFGAAARFHLDAEVTLLSCAPGDPAEPGWERVLLDSVLGVVSLLSGFEALHAAAVERPEGIVAVAGAAGGGKTSLVLELVRRGRPLVTDAVLALRRDPAGVRAYPGPRLATVPVLDDRELVGETLARMGESAWVEVPAALTAPAPRPLAAVVLLDRRGSGPAEVESLQPNPLHLLAHTLPGPRTADRSRTRFQLFEDLADSTPTLRLRAGVEQSPAALADALEDALAIRPPLNAIS